MLMRRLPRCLGLGLALLCACALRAELPESVLEACLSPVVVDHTAGKTWQVLTRQHWESAPVKVTEQKGETLAEQEGLPHPNAWITAQVSLRMPQQTATCPNPTQELTLRLLPNGVTPKTTLSIHFLNKAKLPPYKATLWNGCPALVATAGDWYIIATDKKAKIVQQSAPEQCTSLTLENLSSEKRAPIVASIRVGEGALPPEPKQ